MPVAVSMSDSVSQNFTKRERAAILLAEDELTDEAIAEKVGITRRTLANWKNDPTFESLVSDRVRRIQAAMMRHTIAKKHKRVAVLDDLHTKCLQIIDERASNYAAEAESGKETPAGGGTGLVLRQLKQIGTGRNSQVIEEFVEDVPLMREIRALHEQAAKELGQWTEKSDINLGGSLKREYVIVTEDDE